MAGTLPMSSATNPRAANYKPSAYVGPYSPQVYNTYSNLQYNDPRLAPKAVSGGGGGTGGGGGGSTPTNTGSPLISIQQPDTSGAQARIDEMNNQIRGTINSGFDDINNQLDNMAGLIPGQQKQAEAGVANTYSTLSSGIEDANTNANKTIDLTKQQIQGGVDKSVGDIQNSLRSLLKNAYNQVGAVGAGNSSVAQTLLPYAFSKQYGQQRANIQGQANSQFIDLAKKQLDVQTTYNQQKVSLGQWQNEQTQSIRDKYAGQLQDIANAKINATGQRLQALTSLQTNLLNAAQNELATLRSNAQTLSTQLAGWAADRLATLDNLKLTQQGNSSYSPKDIVYQELQGLGFNNQKTATQSPLNLGVTFGAANKNNNQITL